MDIDDKLKNLQNIQRLDAPHFLFSRIKQKIEYKKYQNSLARWKWATAVCCIFILVFHSFFFFQQIHKSKINAIQAVVKSLSLSNSNMLYYD